MKRSNDSNRSDITFEAASRYLRAGLSIVPTKADGSKAVALSEWKTYQIRLPTETELEKWYLGRRAGISLVCGKVSGDREVLDWDDEETHRLWLESLDNEARSIVDRLVWVETPGGGFHYHYRREGQSEGSKKLALRCISDGENTDRVRIITLAETRGEGACAIMPGSHPHTHPNKREYTLRRGDLSDAPVLSKAERDVLLSSVRAFNEYVEPQRTVSGCREQSTGQARPGDHYNDAPDARERTRALLNSFGWRSAGRCRVGEIWIRPDGKSRSATLFDDSGLFYVFSTNASPFHGDHYYDPFAVYAYLEHAADFSAAARSYSGETGLPANTFTKTEVDVIKEATSFLNEIGEDSTGADAMVALKRASTVLRGCDKVTRVAFRSDAIRMLKAIKLQGATNLVDAVLAEGDDQSDSEQGRAVVFEQPDPWPSEVDGSILLDEISHTLSRYVVGPPAIFCAATLWIVYTYLFDRFHVSPLLALTSPRLRCGKSTLLNLIRLLVRRPFQTSNLTSAVLFRVIASHEPTLLIDEADTFLRPDSKADLIGMINAGHYKPTATVARTVGDHLEVRWFPVWCPKLIAAIGALPPTLTDRAIVLRMHRKSSNETVQSLRLDRPPAVFAELARKANRWALDHGERAGSIDPDVPAAITSDRARDNWRPLLAIADLVGEPWRSFAREAAITLSGGDISSASVAEQLFADIRDLFDDRQTERLETRDILEHLLAMEDRSYKEWGKRGKPINEHHLGKILLDHGVRALKGDGASDKWRGGDNRTCRGYYRAQLEELFTRYTETRPPQPPRGSDSLPYSDIGPPQTEQAVAVLTAGNSFTSKDCGGCGDSETQDKGKIGEIEI